MKTPNEFWLTLHDLAEAYEAEGETPNGRTEGILDQLRAMPPIARQQVIKELLLVATCTEELYPAALAIEREINAQPS